LGASRALNLSCFSARGLVLGDSVVLGGEVSGAREVIVDRIDDGG